MSLKVPSLANDVSAHMSAHTFSCRLLIDYLLDMNESIHCPYMQQRWQTVTRSN